MATSVLDDVKRVYHRTWWAAGFAVVSGVALLMGAFKLRSIVNP